MPMKTFAKLDEVPADVRSTAIESKDGKFLVFEDADTSDLEASIASEKEKREAAEKLVRKTAGELQKLQTQRKAADAGLTEERLKEIQAEALATARAELQPQLDEAVKLRSQNRSLLLDADMKGRALKANIRPERVDKFWKLYGEQFDLTADGKPMVKDKPTLDVEKHLASLAKDNPEWIVGTKASGGGAGGTSAGGAGGAPSVVSVEEAMKNPSQLFVT